MIATKFSERLSIPFPSSTTSSVLHSQSHSENSKSLPVLTDRKISRRSVEYCKVQSEIAALSCLPRFTCFRGASKPVESSTIPINELCPLLSITR